MTIKIFVLFFFFTFATALHFFSGFAKKKRCDLLSCFSFCFYMYINFLFVSNLCFVSSHAERSEIASIDSDIKNIKIYICIYAHTHAYTHTRGTCVSACKSVYNACIYISIYLYI